MQLVRKFSLSLLTTQRDQMPLSHIFSASTSNALYWTKIVIENNSATQPVKEKVGHIHTLIEVQLIISTCEVKGALPYPAFGNVSKQAFAQVQQKPLPTRTALIQLLCICHFPKRQRVEALGEVRIQSLIYNFSLS